MREYYDEQGSGVNAIQSWGDEAPKGVECGEGCSPPVLGGEPHPHRGVQFLFVISKWHILVNYEVLNLKFLFIVGSVGGVRVESVVTF